MYSCNHIFKIFCTQASRKNGEFNFLETNLPKKMDLGMEFQKTNLTIRISILEIISIFLSLCLSPLSLYQHPQDTLSANFHQKWITLTFST